MLTLLFFISLEVRTALDGDTHASVDTVLLFIVGCMRIVCVYSEMYSICSMCI